MGEERTDTPSWNAPNASQELLADNLFGNGSNFGEYIAQMRADFFRRTNGISFFPASLENLRWYSSDGCLLAQHLLRCLTKDDFLPDRFVVGARILTAYSLEFGILDLENLAWETLLGDEDDQLPDNVYTMIAAPDSHVAQVLDNVPINTNPKSTATFMEARRWLDDCQSSHPSCPAPDPQFSPTRLIKLYHGNDQTRCHLQTMQKGTSIPYAALSYCWGGDQTFKTTTNTIAQYELDIHLQSLPQGLQDAVCVAKRLGFSHIWIDALCIVQDSPSDKAYEIGQMARVYGNAAVTIAASRAKAVWDGFLGDRPQLGFELPERVFSLPCFHANRVLGVLSLVPVTFESTEPLDTRGWTFQERVLSPRFLEFGTMRTQFTCRTHINQVCSDGWSKTASSRTYGSFGLDSQVVSNLISGKCTKQEMRALWMRIVEGFTDRALSVASDKLPAIAGMAEAFGVYVQDEYVAGLWRSGLPISLLWSNASSYPEPSLPQTEVPQPSWSWASINGPVRFDRTFVDFRPDVELNVEIQDIGVSLADPRVPFGAVSSAHLTVKAHIQKTEWVQDGTHGSANQLYATDAGVPQDPEAMDLGYLSGAKLAIQLILDSSGMPRTEHLTRPTVLYLALFGWVGANSESGLYPTFFGLALRKTAESNFSRVGIFKKTLSKDRFDEYILWFKKYSKKIIDII